MWKLKAYDVYTNDCHSHCLFFLIIAFFIIFSILQQWIEFSSYHAKTNTQVNKLMEIYWLID